MRVVCPSNSLKLILDGEFDQIFSTVTGYDELDKRIMKIKTQKEHLLVVLENPEVPLHNNRSELGARTQVRNKILVFKLSMKKVHNQKICGTQSFKQPYKTKLIFLLIYMIKLAKYLKWSLWLTLF